ncbi:Uncharacterised protein [Moraxella caviae]|nr:Uncharacterised protein [Moraxella caviae]VEW12539.1 Uncharacterised protein [Moraxella caviae]
MTDKKAVIDAAFAFLVATGGVAPFTITPVPNEPRIKVRLDGDIKRNQVGGDVWSLNFNLKQTF